MPSHGYPINFNAPAGSPLLEHPFYIKYSSTQINTLVKPDVQADLGAALANRESAEVINYLVWLIRTIDLFNSV